jgi:hypothetical protein
VELKREPHPGEVVMEDDVAGTLRRVAADSLPESMTFVEVDGARVPVVRILTTGDGELRIVRSFDATGRELARVVAGPESTPKSAE